MIYFSTFISGLSEIIKARLEKELLNLNIDLLLDGLVVYSTDDEVSKIKTLRFFNNSFLLQSPKKKFVSVSGKTFRVVFSKENELISVNKERLSKIENKIAKLNNLTVDRANPDFEFWFLKRREGQEFTGIRLTRHPDYKTVLAKGQLRPELADILCYLSDPQKTDIILDPFAGSGAIGMARKNYPYDKIFSQDIKIGFDATNMTDILDKSINKIITDPPWGISVGLDLNLPDLYFKLLSEFHRVLKPDGIAVVLMGNKDTFEKILLDFPTFKLINKYNILVSGKKASIYIIDKLHARDISLSIV